MSTTKEKSKQFTEQEKEEIKQQAIKEGRALAKNLDDIDLAKLNPHIEHFYKAVELDQPRLGTFVVDSPIRGAVLASFLVDGFKPLNAFIKEKLDKYIKDKELSCSTEELFEAIEKDVYQDIVYNEVVIDRANDIVSKIMKKLG